MDSAGTGEGSISRATAERVFCQSCSAPCSTWPGHDDDEPEGGSAYDQFGRWVSSTADSKTGGINDVGDAEIAKKMKELHIQEHDETFSMLAQNIFDDNIVIQIPERAAMLKTVRGRTSPFIAETYFSIR